MFEDLNVDLLSTDARQRWKASCASTTSRDDHDPGDLDATSQGKSLFLLLHSYYSKGFVGAV